MEKKKYPVGLEYYSLQEVVGQGVSASVHRALCIPFNETVAIKILDLERSNCDLNNVSRESQTMVLVDHPNVLKSHCSFVSDHSLWVVMPYMAGGSCLHILKAAYPDGFEEVVIATILREALKGLEYLHQHGHIHRDVKAGNILIDSRRGVKLGDFGVSACLFDSGDRQRTRNTFVGTPCWMAPEVMEQLHGYDFKADIWSFGITALELAHGHAPFSKYPPMKVLLMTLQNAPPGLDYERDKKFSRSFKQMIASCLVKDPSKRPSAKKLLKHSFFKQARSNDYISRSLLDGLPELADRMQAIKRREEDMVGQEKIPDKQKEELSQKEYKRGISGWNFNLDDMKAQASLIQDGEDSVPNNNQRGSTNSLHVLDSHEKQPEYQVSPPTKADKDVEYKDDVANKPFLPLVDLNTTRSRSDSKLDDDLTCASPSHEPNLNSSPHHDQAVNNSVPETAMEISGRSTDYAAVPSDRILSPSKGHSDKLQDQFQSGSAYNGGTAAQSGDSELPPKATSPGPDEPDEKAKPPVVQRRGRFKVTSENVELEKVVPSPMLPKSHSMQVLTQHSTASLPPPASASDLTSSSPSSSTIFSMLHSVLQSNIAQRDSILNAMNLISYGDATDNRATEGECTHVNGANGVASEKSLLEAAHEREKELLHEITELQWRLICTQEELQKYKTENAQAASSTLHLSPNF